MHERESGGGERRLQFRGGELEGEEPIEGSQAGRVAAHDLRASSAALVWRSIWRVSIVRASGNSCCVGPKRCSVQSCECKFASSVKRLASKLWSGGAILGTGAIFLPWIASSSGKLQHSEQRGVERTDSEEGRGFSLRNHESL